MTRHEAERLAALPPAEQRKVVAALTARVAGSLDMRRELRLAMENVHHHYAEET